MVYQSLSVVMVIMAIGSSLSFEPWGRFSGALAQPIPVEEPSPIEPKPDPLLPRIPRALSPLETLRLEYAVAKLARLGQREYEAGNVEGAFEQWYRELRLRRSLGKRMEETMALGRIGAIAWEETRRFDINIITERLEIIEQDVRLDAVPSPQLLSALGNAYRQLKDIPRSLALYQRVTDDARRVGDTVTLKQNLPIVGDLHQIRFDYSSAAVAYEELLAIAKEEGDIYHEGVYLSQLARIYQQAAEPENGLRIRQKLEAGYLSGPLIPEQTQAFINNKLAIAEHHEALNQPEQASQAYQTAFALAWAQEWFGSASEALEKLALLYQTYEQPDYALRIYRELLKVKQHSYDVYGLMTTYDHIGQIHLQQENYANARAAFEQALELALALNYRPDYFHSQIEQTNPDASVTPKTDNDSDLNIPEGELLQPEIESIPAEPPTIQPDSATQQPTSQAPLERSPTLIPEALIPQYPASFDILEEQLQRIEGELSPDANDLKLPFEPIDEFSSPRPRLQEAEK